MACLPSTERRTGVQTRIALLCLSLALTSACRNGANEQRADSVLAPRNDEHVPDVVGMTLVEACHELGTSQYAGAVVASHGKQQPAVVLEQNPAPGYLGALAEMVDLSVEGRVRAADLRSACADHRD